MRRLIPVVLILTVLGLIVGLFDDDAPPSVRTSTPAPTISRDQAEGLWEAGTDPHIVKRWDCEPQDQVCTFQVIPIMWMQMDYDFKRDYVAGLGQAAVVLHSSRRIKLVNSMTGAELGSYSPIMGTKIETE